MAQLNWQYDFESEVMSFEIDNLRYETKDGGQNILKYQDNVLIKTIRQFPDEPEGYVEPFIGTGQFRECPNDEWGPELNWLVETYSEQLGEFHRVTAYKDRDGNLVEHDRVLGYGANNLQDLIPINRLGQPASIQERWQYTVIAESELSQPKAPEGIEWILDPDTQKIQRVGKLQCWPCHVFPEVYKPVDISHMDFIDDVKQFKGWFVGPYEYLNK